MQELLGVLRDGGYLVLTVHGLNFMRRWHAPQDLIERVQSGEMIVLNEASAGTGACCAYHPVAYVKEKLASGFEVLDYIPGEVWQDLYLLRKPIYDQGR